jgi:hypothetical protein
MSTLLFAPFYTNQINLIRNIAQCTPTDTRVYVKEHPAATQKGLRSTRYLRDIKAIPNVELVEDNTHDLIKRCDCLISITGTAALEAMMLGKPAIMFGSVHFDFLKDLLWSVRSYDELPELLCKARNFRTDDGKLLDFISAVVAESVDVSLDRLQWLASQRPLTECLEHPEHRRFIDYLVQRIELLMSAPRSRPPS